MFRKLLHKGLGEFAKEALKRYLREAKIPTSMNSAELHSW